MSLLYLCEFYFLKSFRKVIAFGRLLNYDTIVIAEKLAGEKERNDKLRNRLRKQECLKKEKALAAAEMITQMIRKRR